MFEHAIVKAQTVGFAKLTSFHNNAAPSSALEGVAAEFTYIDILKGKPIQSTVTLTTGASSASCGVLMRVGETYLIVLNQGEFKITSCGFSDLIKQSAIAPLSEHIRQVLKNPEQSIASARKAKTDSMWLIKTGSTIARRKAELMHCAKQNLAPNKNTLQHHIELSDKVTQTWLALNSNAPEVDLLPQLMLEEGEYIVKQGIAQNKFTPAYCGQLFSDGFLPQTLARLENLSKKTTTPPMCTPSEISCRPVYDVIDDASGRH